MKLKHFENLMLLNTSIDLERNLTVTKIWKKQTGIQKNTKNYVGELLIMDFAIIKENDAANMLSTISDFMEVKNSTIKPDCGIVNIEGGPVMGVNVKFNIKKNTCEGEAKSFKLSGGFVKVDPTTGERKKFYIKEVIYRNPVVVTLWSDGTKTMSHCNPADTYSCESGLLICVMKKLYGSDKVVELLENWTPTLDVLDQVVSGKGFYTVNLKDVRKKEKAEGRLK